MINNPTIIVLGAGASVPYGYPLGSQLITEIVEGCQVDNEPALFLTLVKNGFLPEDIQKMGRSLNLAKIDSIDYWVKLNPKFKDIAKVAIAHQIRKRVIELSPKKDDWFRFIWRAMTTDCSRDKLKENKIDFITFNYDLSLEYLFANAIVGSYSIRLEEALKFVSKNIRIHHIHGKISAPFTTRGGSLNIEGDYSFSDISKSAEDIVLLGEEIRNTQDFDKAKEACYAADLTVFLGLAYHKDNISRLPFTFHTAKIVEVLNRFSRLYEDWIDGKKVLGSSYGLTWNRQIQTTKYFSKTIKMGNVGHRNLDFLEQNVFLE